MPLCQSNVCNYRQKGVLHIIKAFVFYSQTLQLMPRRALFTRNYSYQRHDITIWVGVCRCVACSIFVCFFCSILKIQTHPWLVPLELEIDLIHKLRILLCTYSTTQLLFCSDILKKIAVNDVIVAKRKYSIHQFNVVPMQCRWAWLFLTNSHLHWCLPCMLAFIHTWQTHLGGWFYLDICGGAQWPSK